MDPRWRVIAAVAALGLAAAAPLAHAQLTPPPPPPTVPPSPDEAANDTGSAHPTQVNVDIVAESPDRAIVFVQQLWTGDNARSMRQSLDVYFGAADGTLAPNELDRIAGATEDDLVNETLDWFRVNGAEGNISEVMVGFQNAAGQVDRTDDLVMTHQLTVSGAASATPDAAEMILIPRWNGNVTAAPPGGLTIVEHGGVDDATVGEDGRLTGHFVQGRDVVLRFGAPGPGPAAESSPEDDGRLPGSGQVPGAPLVAVLAAALVGALVVGRHARRGAAPPKR